MQLKWTNLIELTETGVSKIRGVAGVYRLSYYNLSDQKCHVYYVGQAENLEDRLVDHLPGNETSACCNSYLQKHKCYFRAAAVSLQTDRDGAEAALYRHFIPRCLERVPDTKPLDINFD